MGVEIAALMSFFGLTSAFAVIAAVLGAWMAWRILEKAGFPGWMGLAAVLLTLTGIASIVPLILLWVFAFMRWPRDQPGAVAAGASAPGTAAGSGRSATPLLAAPPRALADRRGWRLNGKLPSGAAVSLNIADGSGTYVLTGAANAKAGELSVPDPSVSQPHARLLSAGGRLGLEDLGGGETFIDGARLLPEHGPRDISGTRILRLGVVELALSRA
jgi:hypothetical protein